MIILQTNDPDCSDVYRRRRRQRKRLYYRLARNSYVDQSLFGPYHREVEVTNEECYHHEARKEEKRKQRMKDLSSSDQKEICRVISPRSQRFLK